MDRNCCPGCTLSPATLVAVGLGGLFVIFMFVTGVMIRWWIMLPLGLAAFSLFMLRRGQAEGLERTICDWGYFGMLAMLVLRDACLSSRLAGIYGAVEKVAGVAAKNALDL